MNFEHHVLRSINSIASQQLEPEEIIECLDVLKNAALDVHSRDVLRRQGGVGAILHCLLHNPTLDILETSATCLLLLVCNHRGNTTVCNHDRFSNWKKETTTVDPYENKSSWYDISTVRAIIKVCNARAFLSLFKSHPNRERLVHAFSWLMLATCEVEKKTGLVARNDGGITFLLDILWSPLTLDDGTHAPRSALSLQAPLLLLCLFTQTSESNVFAIAKARGFTILCKLTERHQDAPLVAAAALTALSNCCRSAKMATVCGRASPAVQKATEAIEALVAVQGTPTAVNGGGEMIERRNVVTMALKLLFHLSKSSSNVPAVVACKGLETVHVLLNTPFLPLHLCGLCCKVCWKLLAVLQSDHSKDFQFDKMIVWHKEYLKKSQKEIGGSGGGTKKGGASKKSLRRMKKKEARRAASLEVKGDVGGGGGDTLLSAALLKGEDGGSSSSYCDSSGVDGVKKEESKCGGSNNSGVERGGLSDAAIACHCTEEEMNVMRKFPELIGLQDGNSNTNGAGGDDDEVLHGWGDGTNNSRTKSVRHLRHSHHTPSNMSQDPRAQQIHNVLTQEFRQTMSSTTVRSQTSSNFALDHALLPTASGPLGEATTLRTSTEEDRYPLRLNVDTHRDSVRVQQQCINRMIAMRNQTLQGGRSGGETAVKVYDIEETKEGSEGGKGEEGKQQTTTGTGAATDQDARNDFSFPKTKTQQDTADIVARRRLAREQYYSSSYKDSYRSGGSGSGSGHGGQKLGTADYEYKCAHNEDPVMASTSASLSFSPSIWSAPPLKFESRFECGNLNRVYRTGNYEYNLLVSNDINTKHCTQWYFFSVLGMVKGQKYCFNIVNFDKTGSQYNHGMQPCVYSELLAETNHQGWFRRGSNVCYYQNLYKKTKGNVLGTATEKKVSLNTLTFTDIHHLNQDRLYYAFCLPYTATDCYKRIDALQQYELHHNSVNPGNRHRSGSRRGSSSGGSNGSSKTNSSNTNFNNRIEEVVAEEDDHGEADDKESTGILLRTVLCHTLGGLPVPLLTITDFKAPVAEIANRKYICLSGRVHPGESPASYMMDGVISFLCGGSEVAKRLRKIAVFKIVPMLNPDGVATGNNRCNLAGHDLNRTWTAPSVSLSPTIYHWKQLISMQIERRNRSDARSNDRSTDRSNDSSGLGGIVDYVSSSTLGNRNGVGGGSVPSSEGVSLFCDFHGKWCIGDFCCWFFLLLLAKILLF